MTIDRNIAAQMLGLIDYRVVEPLDRPITAEERDLAIEIGYEIAMRHGLALAAHVAAQHEREAAYRRQMEAEY